jgi:ubiquinone/menaquinone biosynthesis C-methylase UbiE
MLSLDKQNQLREEYRQLRPGWSPATETYADLVRSHLAPNSRLLDLGCGRGGLIEQLVKTHGHGLLQQTLGLDPDWLSLTQHRLDLPAASGFSHALPFKENSFDIVFCSWLLEHLETPQIDLAEIGRVLKPGGRFVFITPNKKHPIAWLNRTIGRFSALQDWLVERLYGRKGTDTFPTFFRANSQIQLKRYLDQISAFDFQIEQLHFVADPTYLAFHPLIFRFMCWFETALPTSRRLHLVGVLHKTTQAPS